MAGILPCNGSTRQRAHGLQCVPTGGGGHLRSVGQGSAVFRSRGHIFRPVIGKAEGKGEEHHGHVSAVTVAPEYRRLGLARKLMNEFEGISEEKCVPGETKKRKHPMKTIAITAVMFVF